MGLFSFISKKSKKEAQMPGTITFGAHITIDGYGGDPKKLNDREIVYRCLNELPGLIGMKKLAEPFVYEAPAAGPKDSGGFSGFVIIATSHISCHTFPGRHFVSIDAYSCEVALLKREFVVDYFKKAFDLQDVEVNYIKRGTRFPDKELE